MATAGGLLDLNEYFVRHEDVRRANGEDPRTDRPDLDDDQHDVEKLWAADLSF